MRWNLCEIIDELNRKLIISENQGSFSNEFLFAFCISFYLSALCDVCRTRVRTRAHAAASGRSRLLRIRSHNAVTVRMGANYAIPLLPRTLRPYHKAPMPCADRQTLCCTSHPAAHFPIGSRRRSCQGVIITDCVHEPRNGASHGEFDVH